MCNCKGKLIYKSHLQRRLYHQYLKVYKDDYGNLTYDVLNEDYVIHHGVDVFDCETRFPDVLQEISTNRNYEIDISVDIKKYFDKLLETGTFKLVDSKIF
jgi:hypothetical protein